MLLAGFAFESYNQPDIEFEVGADGTRTGLLSPAFIREYYDGVIAIDAVKAQVFRPPGLLPLQGLDTYLVMQVGEGEPVRTDTVYGDERPEWKSGQTLYVRGEDATLLLSVYCDTGPLGDGPKLLGRAQVPVAELGSNIKLWGERHPLSGGGGRVELKATFVRFSSSDSQIDADLADVAASVGSGELGAAFDSLGSAFSQWRAKQAVIGTTGTASERRGSTLTSQRRSVSDPTTWLNPTSVRGPRGAAGVDWSELAVRLGGAAAGGEAFEACCFVENPRTNTQCGVWRQSESRTLVLSFRGTQQDELTDIITDLSFVQRPATPKANEQSVAARQAEMKRIEASKQVEAVLQAALAALKASDAEAALEELRPLDSSAALLRAALREEDEALTRLPLPSDLPPSEIARREGGQGEGEGEGQPMVHQGFYGALKSVLPRLLRLLPQLTHTAEDEGVAGQGGWTVFVTGHSLGGALATLMAWEIEALRERDLPDIGKVALYNFGSPRVGNPAFAASFNAAIGTAFRVVNRKDVVARVPNYQLPGGDWQQVGRTVLVQADGQKEEALWIEGEMAGTCPISIEADPLSASEVTAAAAGGGGRLELLKSVFGGQGVSDHLEDAYHAGMGAAVTSWVWRKALYSAAVAPGGALGAPPATIDTDATVTPVKLGSALRQDIDEIVREELSAALANAEPSAEPPPPGRSTQAGGEAGALAVSSGTRDSAAAVLDEPLLLVERVQARAVEDARYRGGVAGEQPASDSAVANAVASSLKAEVSTLLSDGTWELRDLSLLLRIVLVLGANLSPAARLLPVQMLLKLYSAQLTTELGERTFAAVVERLQDALYDGASTTIGTYTGKQRYEFGDITKKAVSDMTGKPVGDYKFGDITKTITGKLFGEEEGGQGKGSKG